MAARTTSILSGSSSFTNFNDDTLNSVRAENVRLEPNIFLLKLPSLDSGGATNNLGFGFMPKELRIIVTGRFSGSDAQVQAFIDEIYTNWAKSGIQSERTYTTRWSDAFTVMCDGFDYSSNEGSDSAIEWTMELVEVR